MKIPRQSVHSPRAGLPARMFCVDPGTTESAFVLFDCSQPLARRIHRFGKVRNALLLCLLLEAKPHLVVCEEIRSYGMPVGKTTLDTVRFTGRIEQLCQTEGIPFALISRQEVKKSFKPLPRRNDKDIRAALISIYGEPGIRTAPGPTFGITKDVWAALGVAHAYRKKLLE